MGDEQVAELCPLWSGEKSHQVAFDLLDGLRGRQRESCRDSGYMCIDDDAEVDPECIAQNHIGGSGISLSSSSIISSGICPSCSSTTRFMDSWIAFDLFL